MHTSKYSGSEVHITKIYKTTTLSDGIALKTWRAGTGAGTNFPAYIKIEDSVRVETNQGTKMDVNQIGLNVRKRQILRGFAGIPGWNSL